MTLHGVFILIKRSAICMWTKRIPSELWEEQGEVRLVKTTIDVSWEHSRSPLLLLADTLPVPRQFRRFYLAIDK
jgi:hypothetical protein